MLMQRVCEYCGKPYIGHGFKYCPDCRVSGKNAKQAQWRARNRDHRIASGRARRKQNRCVCCHKEPIAKGFRFLCRLCWKYHGSDWIALESVDRFTRYLAQKEREESQSQDAYMARLADINARSESEAKQWMEEYERGTGND